jgi:hypothetical protein
MVHRPNAGLTAKQVAAAILNARSWAAAIKTLGLPIAGGSYRLLQKHARVHDVSTAHFTGQGWRRGMTRASQEDRSGFRDPS